MGRGSGQPAWEQGNGEMIPRGRALSPLLAFAGPLCENKGQDPSPAPRATRASSRAPCQLLPQAPGGLGQLIAFDTFKIPPGSAGRGLISPAPGALKPFAVGAVPSPQDAKHKISRREPGPELQPGCQHCLLPGCYLWFPLGSELVIPFSPCISPALCLYLCSSGGRRKGSSVERTDNTLHAASGDGTGLRALPGSQGQSKELSQNKFQFSSEFCKP